MQPTIFLQQPYNIKPVEHDAEYIQILFTGQNECGHWICMYYCNDIIHIYDSFNQKCLTEDQMIYINRLFPNKNNLKITFETVQQQDNIYDCGIFSIAFVISLIFNVCPCGLIFDIKLMRKHLLELYHTSMLTMFPVSKNHFNNNLFISNHTPLIRNIIHYQQFFIIPVNFDNVNFEILEQNKINYFARQQHLLFQQYNATKENLLIETNKTSLDKLQQ